MKRKVGKFIAVRPEQIVESRNSLSRAANALVDIMLSKIDERDRDCTLFQINASEYAKFFRDKRPANVYRDLREAALSFKDEGFEIKGENNEYIYIQWFASIRWIGEEADDEGEGAGRYGDKFIELEISTRLRDLLLTMKRAAYYKIEDSLNLSSQYAQRIYYMLKLDEFRGTRMDELDDLQEKLRIPKTYRERYPLFLKRVLLPAIKEINEKTDIDVTIKEIKSRGRSRVRKIKFTITKKDGRDDLVTKLGLSETEYEFLKSVAEQQLGNQDWMTEDTAEEYLQECIDAVSPENIEISKVKYMIAVMENPKNIQTFCTKAKGIRVKAKVREENVKMTEQIERKLAEEKREEVKAWKESKKKKGKGRDKDKNREGKMGYEIPSLEEVLKSSLKRGE